MRMGRAARWLHVLAMEEIERLLIAHISEEEERSFNEHAFEFVRSMSGGQIDDERVLTGLVIAVNYLKHRISPSDGDDKNL